MSEGLFRKVDGVQIPVPDLEAGIEFYRGRLGHELIWRTKTAAGLRMPETDAELVLHTEPREMETDLLVESAEEAVSRVADAGGRVVVAPFDIAVGRCAVEDPWGNRIVVLDLTRGVLVTDRDGVVQTDANGQPRVRGAG